MGKRNLAMLAAGFSLALSLACSQPQPQGYALPRQESEKICYFPSGFEDTEKIEMGGVYKICEIPFQFKEPEKYINCYYRPDWLGRSGEVIGQMRHLETIISSYNSDPEIWRRQACADSYRWNDELTYKILIKTAGNYPPPAIAFSRAHRRTIEEAFDFYLGTTPESAMAFELYDFIAPKKVVGVGIIFPADSPDAQRFMGVWNERAEALLKEGGK